MATNAAGEFEDALKRLEEIATQEEGWLTSRVHVEPRHNTESDLSELIGSLCRSAELQASRGARIRKTMRGVVASARGLIRVSWQDIEVSLGAPGDTDEQRSVVKALFDVAVLADEHGYGGYLVMLDEAQVIRDDRDRGREHPLSLLVAAINTLQEKEVPVGLALCGLPTLRSNLLRARTYTERMFRGEEIGRLAGPEAVEALVRPLDETGITAKASLVDRVREEVEGYPFFIQLSGAAGRRRPLRHRVVGFGRARHLPAPRHRLLRRPGRVAHPRRAGPFDVDCPMPVPAVADSGHSPQSRQKRKQRECADGASRRARCRVPSAKRPVRVHGPQVPRLPQTTGAAISPARPMMTPGVRGASAGAHNTETEQSRHEHRATPDIQRKGNLVETSTVCYG